MYKKNILKSFICLALATWSGASVFATTSPLLTGIGDGAMTITGVGDYGCAVALTSINAPVLTDTISYFDAGTLDYFTIKDNDGDSGSRLRAYFSSAIWDYSGIYQPSTDSTIPATSGRLIPSYDYDTFEPLMPTKIVKDPIQPSDLATGYTWMLDGLNTAVTAQDTSLYTFPDLNASYVLTGTSVAADAEIFRSTATAPFQGVLRIDRMELTVPTNASNGLYGNTLNMILVAGSGI